MRCLSVELGLEWMWLVENHVLKSADNWRLLPELTYITWTIAGIRAVYSLRSG